MSREEIPEVTKGHEQGPKKAPYILGRLRPLEVMRSDTKRLLALIETETSALTETSHAITDLIKSEKWNGFENKLPHPNAWNKEKVLQLLAFVLDGKTNYEIAEWYKTTRGNVQAEIQTHLTAQARILGRKASLLRRQHEFLYPENPSTKVKLDALELALELPREKIFLHVPTLIDEASKARGHIRKTQKLRSPHMLIELAYDYVCLGANYEQLAKRASKLLGRTVQPDEFTDYFSKNFTRPAASRMGVQENHEWNTGEYKQIASMIIGYEYKKQMIFQKKIADTLGVTKNSLKGTLRVHSRYLVKNRPEYKDIPLPEAFVAFLLEYGNLTGPDARARARAIAKRFTDRTGKSAASNALRAKKNSQE